MKPMPFFSQMVNWDGEDSGFPDTASVQQWERNCCGIACLRMILAYFRVPNERGELTYWNLLQAGLARGAYSEKGWVHHGLLGLAADHGIRGQCHRRVEISHVTGAIQRGSVCVVSVTRFFLGGQIDGPGEPLPKGGHLVVAYDTVTKGSNAAAIVCNHPSSGRPWNKIAWPVDLEKWERSFSGNYVEFFAGQGEPSG